METKESRVGHVARQLDLLEEGLNRLAERVSTLDQRLSLVCRATPGVPDAESPKEDLVPLAERLRCDVERLESSSGVLQSILERLEL